MLAHLFLCGTLSHALNQINEPRRGRERARSRCRHLSIECVMAHSSFLHFLATRWKKQAWISIVRGRASNFWACRLNSHTELSTVQWTERYYSCHFFRLHVLEIYLWIQQNLQEVVLAQQVVIWILLVPGEELPLDVAEEFRLLLMNIQVQQQGH